MGYIVIGSMMVHLLVCLLLLKKNQFRLTMDFRQYLTRYYFLFLAVVCGITVAIDVMVDKACLL
jgi:hypothetical protein